MAPVREPAVSGTFYPGNPRVLQEDIRQYLKLVPAHALKGDIKGLISPHAGYMYSGQVAAYGYKTLTGSSYDTVVIVAPSHRAYFEGVAVQDTGGYKTPLGLVPVDEQAARAIMEAGTLVRSNATAHKGEHSIEVQLPFLQVVLGNTAIVPLMMGDQAIPVCQELAEQVMKGLQGLGRSVLVIGSTDLSHYFPHARAVQLDGAITTRLAAFDVKGLEEDLAAERGEACGAGPTITTMLIARKLGANKAAMLKYANSGDVSGDRSAVVGYASCAFYAEEKAA